MSNEANGASVIVKPEAIARIRAEKKSGKKKAIDKDEERKAAQRAYYHANKENILAKMREKRNAKKKGSLPGKTTGARPVPTRTGNPKDALIYLQKSMDCLDQRDYEGTRLYAALSMRVLKGKE